MKNIAIKRETKCRICKSSSKVQSIFDLKSTPIADYYSIIKLDNQKKYELSLKFCKNCNYTFLSKTLKADVSYTNYLYHTSTTTGLGNHYDEYIDSITKKFKILPKSLVLDIGSNDGAMLLSMKKKGLNPLGIEPAKKISDFANSKKLKTINAYFNDQLVKKILKKYGKPKIITANYMFANVDDISLFVKNIFNIIDEQGIFVIQTGYHPVQFSNMMFDYIYHEHYSYFSLFSLIKLLKKNDLKLVDASINNHKLGSLRAVFSLENSKFTVNKKQIKKILLKEFNYNNYPKKSFKYFKYKLDTNKQKITNFFVKNYMKKFVGFGASHSVTTFLFYHNIGNYLSCIVDDNIIKQNTFSPKLNIPVYNPKVLRSIKPNFIIILGWQHAKSIISKHKKLISISSFIIPLPNLKIINQKNIKKYLDQND